MWFFFNYYFKTFHSFGFSKLVPLTIVYLKESCYLKKTNKQKHQNQTVILFLLISVSAMSDKSELKAELERKKQRLAQIREEKKRKEEERKKKEVRNNFVFEISLSAYVTCLKFKGRFT